MADLSDKYWHVYMFLEIIGFVTALLEKKFDLRSACPEDPAKAKLLPAQRPTDM